MKQIKTKLTRLVVASTIIVSLIIGVMGILVTRYSTNRAVEKNLAELPTLAAMAAQNSISTYTYTVGEIATDEILTSKTNSNSQKDAFIQSKVTAYYMRSGGYVDTNGYDAVNDIDVSGEPFFEAAVNGATYMSTPYINEAKDDAYMVVASPVKAGEEIIGVVYFHCDTILLQTIVADLQVGTKGYAYILDKNGTVIACTDEAWVYDKKNVIEDYNDSKNKKLKEQVKLEKKMIAGESGTGTYSSDHKKIMQGYAPIPNTDGWSVAIAINRNEFTRPALFGSAFFITVIIICLIVMIRLSKKQAEQIANPIALCTERLRQLAQGDLKSIVPRFNTKDEVEILAESTSDLVSTFNRIVYEFTSCLSSIAAGDLTRKEIQGYFPGDFAVLKEHLQKINEKLNITISGIAEAAEQVSESASQVSTTSSALSDGAANQEKTVENLVATVTDINDIAHRTASLTEQARASAEGAGVRLATSNEHIADLENAMSNIITASGEIKNVVDTIESISQRTNMLALNASIEAARAGETGKGFAVVAVEVGNLAAQSAEAVKITKELISHSMSAVNQGNTVVKAVTASLSEVIALASDSVSKMQVVAEAVEGQTMAIQKIITNTEQISDVAQSTSFKADEGAETSQELFKQADSLKQLIDGFSLNKK